MKKKVLAVVASTQTLRSGGATGYTLEELAAPYARFREAGFEIDIASPNGGPVTYDPAFADGVFLTEDGRALVDDTEVQAKLNATIALSDVEPAKYDAVFLVGGVPAAGDFDANPALTSVLDSVLRRGGALGGVCHGVVGLADLKRSDGSFAAQGHPMTGFSLDEEVEADLVDEVAVVPETRLRERGAEYRKAADLWGVCVVAGEHFVTGQNPASAGATAEAIVERMERT